MIRQQDEMRLSQLRAKSSQGIELSLDEMREVVAIIAAGRSAAAASSASAKRHESTKVVRSAEDMLKGLPQ